MTLYYISLQIIIQRRYKMKHNFVLLLLLVICGSACVQQPEYPSAFLYHSPCSHTHALTLTLQLELVVAAPASAAVAASLAVSVALS